MINKFLGLILLSTWGILTMTTANASSSDITIPIKRLPSTLDPQHYEDIYSMVGILQTHRGLMRFKPNLEIDTDLAEAFKILDDGKRIQFSLKSRTFSNGVQIEAMHVVRTFQRMFLEKGGFSADLSYFVGAKEILNGKAPIETLGVKVINESQFEEMIEHAR